MEWKAFAKEEQIAVLGGERLPSRRRLIVALEAGVDA